MLHIYVMRLCDRNKLLQNRTRVIHPIHEAHLFTQLCTTTIGRFTSDAVNFKKLPIRFFSF
jgi:hypothetical protein